MDGQRDHSSPCLFSFNTVKKTFNLKIVLDSWINCKDVTERSHIPSPSFPHHSYLILEDMDKIKK